MDNREWLRSLSDKQLAEEIRYTRLLADDDHHSEHHKKSLEEALAEQNDRNTKAE